MFDFMAHVAQKRSQMEEIATTEAKNDIVQCEQEVEESASEEDSEDSNLMSRSRSRHTGNQQVRRNSCKLS